MKVELKPEKDNIAIISIETDPGRGSEAYKKTASHMANHMNVPGFRKGKVPLKIVEDKVGADNLRSETLQALMPEVLAEAFKQEDLEVMNIAGVNSVDFQDPDGPIKIEATIELMPEVKLGKYKGLKLSVEVPKFEETEYMEKTLDRISDQVSEFEEVNDAIAMGDEVVFDFDGRVKETGEKVEGMKAEGYQAIVEPGRFIENFLEQMVGMKAGDEQEIEVKFPDEYHNETLNGKEAIFALKVHKVSRAKKHELNDELAKKVGSEDMKDLKKRIVEEMEKIQAANEKSACSEALITQISMDAKLDIPASMVDREFEASLENMRRQYGMPDEQWDEFKQNINADEEKKVAEERIRRSLIISSLMKEEKVDISEDELSKAMRESMSRMPPNVDPTKLDMNAFARNVRTEALTEKLIDTLIAESKVDIKYISEEEYNKQKEEKASGKSSKSTKSKAGSKKTAKKSESKSEKKPKAKKAKAKS